ncbi:MAG: helix-turn-helix transcriptional regulator [Gammaproteobacteria bacterium]|nr:helix-turn-helix transcriptional regulator [Gammaproteobacteria bacterium]
MNKTDVVSHSSEGDIVNEKRPIIAVSANIDCSHLISPHKHHRGQLIYSLRGALSVKTENKTWHVTPEYGIWIAPNEIHQIKAIKAVSYRSAFLEPDALSPRFNFSHAISIPLLFKELLNEASSINFEYQNNTAESRLHEVLFDRFCFLEPEKFSIPMPNNELLKILVKDVFLEPNSMISLKDLSQKFNVCEKTLSRKFKRETGLSFSQWKQHVCIALAVEKIKNGESLTSISFDLGYNSPSAFSTMFRRVTGMKPSQYLLSK